MRFQAGRGLIGLGVAFALAALIGAGAAVAESDNDADIACAPTMALIEDDPDAEIPSDDLDDLLMLGDADEEDVELLPYLMGGRELLENVRFDVGDEFT